MKKKKSTSKSTSATYKIGEVHSNPYLGNRTTEILSINGQRVGFVWTHSDGKNIVSPNLGFYIWFNENGENWTLDSGAAWLIKHRRIQKSD